MKRHSGRQRVITGRRRRCASSKAPLDRAQSSFPRKRELSGCCQSLRRFASGSWTAGSLFLRLVLLALVLGNIRAPRRRLDRSRGLPDDIELAICLYLADEDGLVQMV